jgi:hypothetical protein
MSCSGPPSSAGSPAITNDVVESVRKDTGTLAPATPAAAGAPRPTTREHGGRDGPEPTRFGDWEKGGRCIDF